MFPYNFSQNAIIKFAAAAKKTAQAANLNFNAADSQTSGDTFASVWAHSYTAMYTEAVATLRSEKFATGANISLRCGEALILVNEILKRDGLDSRAST